MPSLTCGSSYSSCSSLIFCFSCGPLLLRLLGHPLLEDFHRHLVGLEEAEVVSLREVRLVVVF